MTCIRLFVLHEPSRRRRRRVVDDRQNIVSTSSSTSSSSSTSLFSRRVHRARLVCASFACSLRVHWIINPVTARPRRIQQQHATSRRTHTRSHLRKHTQRCERKTRALSTRAAVELVRCGVGYFLPTAANEKHMPIMTTLRITICRRARGARRDE